VGTLPKNLANLNLIFLRMWGSKADTAPIRALHQPCAEFVFQLLNLVTERGLRDVQQKSNPSKVKFFCKWSEETQVSSLHGERSL